MIKVHGRLCGRWYGCQDLVLTVQADSRTLFKESKVGFDSSVAVSVCGVAFKALAVSESMVFVGLLIVVLLVV